jgi:leucyl aminopeptidase
MTLAPYSFVDADAAEAATHAGRVVVFADVALDAPARKLDRLTRGALSRALASDAWAKVKPGKGLELAFPAGLAARAVHLLRLPRGAAADVTLRAGALIGKAIGPEGALVLASAVKAPEYLAEGALLRAYGHAIKAAPLDRPGAITFAVKDPVATQSAAAPLIARAEAVHFTRDLVNDPANILTTTEFAARLESLRDLGLTVTVIDEPELDSLGLRALLAVGQGSESPSKVVIMQWKGADEAPLALVGKGVVFDTGGISIKPAASMEEMIMDMGGAAVVAGVMRTLAARKAQAHVVGIVGLVENMPDGRAQRPGDVVRSLKGDTIEVINTDAEGRLVLADILWLVQDRYNPAQIIDFATLTGAIMVALGSENAGLFANDDALADGLLAASRATGEGAWRMPLDESYDTLIDSRVADMKNTGGRWGGAVTAAKFLQRFVKPGTPWAHLDIAGVAMPGGETTLAPKGATGWGVRLIDSYIRARERG